MNELEYLRKVLASAPTVESATAIPSETDSVSLMKKLRNLQNSQTRINQLKLIVIFLILTSLIINIYILGITSIMIYIGIILIVLSAATFMTFYIKNQFNTSRLDYSLNSIQFAKQAIELLKKQKRIFGMPFMLFIFFMIIGANLLFLGMGTDSLLKDSIFSHIVFSTLIAIFGSIGLLVRRWRTKREVEPLIKELTLIVNDTNDTER